MVERVWIDQTETYEARSAGCFRPHVASRSVKSTVRYLGVGIDNALDIAGKIGV